MGLQFWSLCVWGGRGVRGEACVLSDHGGDAMFVNLSVVVGGGGRAPSC